MDGRIIISSSGSDSIRILPFPTATLERTLTSPVMYRMLQSGNPTELPVDAALRMYATVGLKRRDIGSDQPLLQTRIVIAGTSMTDPMMLVVVFQRLAGGDIALPTVTGNSYPVVGDLSTAPVQRPSGGVRPRPRSTGAASGWFEGSLPGSDRSRTPVRTRGSIPETHETPLAWGGFRKFIARDPAAPESAHVHFEIPRTNRPVAPTVQPVVLSGDEVRVWFGTNRKRIKTSDGKVYFAAEPGKTLHYGQCRVWIDGKRPKGGFYRFWDRLSIMLGRDEIQLRGVTGNEPDEFWAALRGALTVAKGGKSLLLFVHGFCNTFETAACTAAVLARDACRGLSEVAFFSWPSSGTPELYGSDLARTEASEGAFLGFFRDLMTKSTAETVHVVAHSMGARLVARTLEKMQSEHDRSLKIENLIFASPDVEQTMFLEINRSARVQIARRVLYVSDHDIALKMSRWPLINNSHRAGLRPPWTVAENIETIDATKVDLSSNGHRAFREAPAVLDDLFRLTTRPESAKLRGLKEAEVVTGIQTWEFVEERR